MCSVTIIIITHMYVSISSVQSHGPKKGEESWEGDYYHRTQVAKDVWHVKCVSCINF